MLKVFTASNTEKSWAFIKKIRNIEKQRIVIDTQRNNFGEIITNGKHITNFSTFKFSTLGENFGERKKIDKTLFSADTGNANHDL